MEYAGGWSEGEPLPGSKEIPENERLTGLFRDGLHFSPKGCVVPGLLKACMWLTASRYEIMYEQVMSVILKSFPELDPTSDELKYVYPYWEVAPKA